MPRPKNPTAESLMKAGISRRQAFRVARIIQSPIARQLYRAGRLSADDAARLAKDYPDHGEQCLLAFHVMSGWRLRDAEEAYWEAVHAIASEVLGGNPDVAVGDLHRIIDDRVAGPVRRMEYLPRIVPIGTIPDPSAPVHPPDPIEQALAEAVAEIQRLRSKLYDLGVDPDS